MLGGGGKTTTQKLARILSLAGKWKQAQFACHGHKSSRQQFEGNNLLRMEKTKNQNK